MEWKRELLKIVDDPDEINIDIVSRLLAGTYWGHRRSPAIIKQLIQNSLCFSLFSDHEQIGFARIVTDYTVFSWLSDLVIDEAFRNQGIGEWFIDCILKHPSISHTQFVLQTKNADQLYKMFEFKVSDKLMTRMPPST